MDLIAAIIADPNIGADFRAALARSEDGNGQALVRLRRAGYVSALLRFDHRFESSRNPDVWRAGCNELERLRKERTVVDPDGALWARNMHENFRHG